MPPLPRRRSQVRLEKPGFVEYLNPTTVDQPPSAAGWVHEVKWDGFRVQAHLQAGKVRMFIRNGNDWTYKFGPLPAAIGGLAARDAILDGEVVAIGQEGISDFHELRRQLSAARPQLRYQAFDLLWLDGQDFRPLPLSERKTRLANLLEGAPPVLAYVDSIEGGGRGVFRGACKLHLEGIVSKGLRPERDSGWQSVGLRAARCADWIDRLDRVVDRPTDPGAAQAEVG